MAFRLGQISYPNLTTDYSGELNAAAQLGKTVAGLPEQWRKQAEEERTKSLLADAMKTGDYSKAGMALLGAGKIEQGAALVGLGQKAQTLEGQREIGRLLGGSAPAPTTLGAPPAPMAPPGMGAVSNSSGSAAPRPFDRPVQVAETEADVQRLEADMERRSQIGYGNPALPAGMRNNNPGNIKYVRPGQAAGVLGPSQNTDQGDPQAVFNSPEAGMRAAYELAMRKYQGGKRTALDLIAGENGWTPGNAAAAANIAKGMGLAPNEDLRLDDPQRAQAFLAALAAQEHGRAGGSYPREMIAGAVTGQPAAGTQVASAPAASAAGPEGVYGNTPPEQLQAFIDNPRVPENLRSLMQQELARRGGGAPAGQPAPVQMAEAAPQPGAPVADMPAAGANAAQFAVPGAMMPPNDPLPQVSNQALLGIIANPSAADGQRALAQNVLANRQKYSDENAPDKREQTRLATTKAQLEVEKLKREGEGSKFRSLVAPEERAAAGVDPNYKGPVQVDRDGKLYLPGKPTSEVNIDTRTESEYAKENGKAISKRFAGIVDEGDAAQQEAGAIARLKELGGQIKNMGAGAALQARLAEFGIKVGENVSEIEAYNALVDKLTPQQRVAGAGATSDFDAKMFKNSLPGLMRTPQGNALILETLESLNAYKRQRADVVAEAMALNEKPGEVIKRLRDLPDPFASFKEARKAAPGQPSAAPQPGAPAPAAPQPSADGWQDLGNGVRIREKR